MCGLPGDVGGRLFQCYQYRCMVGQEGFVLLFGQYAITEYLKTLVDEDIVNALAFFERHTSKVVE